MVGLTHEQALYVLINRMVQSNMKRQNRQISVKNVTLMSAKTVSIDIIPVFNLKGGRLYDIFAMKVTFFWLIICF